MKKLILVICFCFAASSNASYFVQKCSTADNSFSSIQGHVDGRATKYRIFNEKNEVVQTVELKDFLSRTISNSVLQDKSSVKCFYKKGSGISTWEKFEFVKKVISLKNEELFPKELVGVSRDRKRLTVALLCRTIGNSRSFCNK